MIRKAEKKDLSRIAEILVFDKRMNYRSIFKNDDYSFHVLQVLDVAKEYAQPEILDHIFVYDDGIVKGLIHLEQTEIAEFYVDHFFQNQGIGAALMEYAKQEHWTICGCLRKTNARSGFMKPTAFLFPGKGVWKRGRRNTS